VRIGILGSTGPAGTALGARLASVGYEVILGSRSLERATQARDALFELWPTWSLALDASDNEGTAAGGEIVVVATPWDSAATTAGELERHLSGKVVICMANALVRVGREFQALVLPRGSVAAHVQAAVPSCRVVAAFHHVPAKELGELGEPVESDVLICSDDPSATAATAEIVNRIPGCRSLDVGGLTHAMAIEAFTATLLQLNVRYKTRVAPKFTGIRS
jgi:8-hydroxy-5-deazaflavin:NADPH oxidoreductase